MVITNQPSGQPFDCPSILLASDSERLGTSLHQALQQHGFPVQFAGHYSGLDDRLHREPFDVILLEVTNENAVEPAIQAALRLKRANSSQFVGYLADPSLDASGLAGDGVFPRSVTTLPAALRSFFADTSFGETEPRQP